MVVRQSNNFALKMETLKGYDKAQTFTMIFYEYRVLKIFNQKDEINERFSNAMKNNMTCTSRSIVSAVTSWSLTWARRVIEVGETKIQNKILMRGNVFGNIYMEEEKEKCVTVLKSK
jgi:NAD-specific glutamate dehydrogenase